MDEGRTSSVYRVHDNKGLATSAAISPARATAVVFAAEQGVFLISELDPGYHPSNRPSDHLRPSRCLRWRRPKPGEKPIWRRMMEEVNVCRSSLLDSPTCSLLTVCESRVGCTSGHTESRTIRANGTMKHAMKVHLPTRSSMTARCATPNSYLVTTESPKWHTKSGWLQSFRRIPMALKARMVRLNTLFTSVDSRNSAYNRRW